MSDSIRIRTTPNSTDQYLKVKIEQDFDFIKILSLNISQDKAYENFCSDYGVIVGRVSINNGFGIPNAKVSVFIPIDDNDNQNPLISGIYPYKTVNDKNSDGIRYNLLPQISDSQSDCYTPVGTFPSKREVLDNDEVLYVYCKYYKFTTTTNYAGDFMIFGVPLGTYTVHVDADISNIGIASQKPYDLIEQGTPTKFFYSPTKFKGGANLNNLVQIKSANIGVNVQPFWGDINNCQIGINRMDIDLNYQIRPAAFFMGSVFGDNNKNSVNKNCIPRKKMGLICEQVTSQGSIEMIRKTLDGQIEKFDIDGGRLIDDDGAWAYQIPMNLDYVVTDEFGNLIPSKDPNKGIPTRSRVRFRISMDEGGGLGRLRTRGKYLVPHNPRTQAELDFNFDSTTKDKNFVDMFWNKIYTVKNFISRVDRNGGDANTSAFVGVKDVDGCVGDKNPFPYNRGMTKGNMLFTIICIIINIVAIVVAAINAILCVEILGVKPFGFISPISLSCPSEPSQSFKPGCGGQSVSDFVQCVAAVLADQLNLFRLDFYNDWVNGTLYYYLLKYKKKRSGSERFCETYCTDFAGGTGYNDCKNLQLTDTTYSDDGTSRDIGFRNGVMVQYQNILYYPPVLIGNGGAQRKLYATDIFNLGSILDCDWQGFPNIIKYLTDTSYKLPPLIQEVDPSTQEIESGMIRVGDEVGLFFDVGCFGVSFDATQATNIRRQSELFVEIPESTTNVGITQISINQIYNQTDPQFVQDNSISKYVRDVLYQLNISGSSINTYPLVDPASLSIPAQGTSFMINPTNNGNGGNQHEDGTAYWAYRGYDILNNDMSFQALGNSYFMYFGVKPGKSAIEKFTTKYYTPCIKETKDDFLIIAIVGNTSTPTSTDGYISLSFVGGTPPFTYIITGDNFDLGPLTATTGAIITGLANSNIPYTITTVDVLGTIVTRDVIVSGPGPLSCDFIVVTPATANNANGVVEMTQLVGGIEPYRLNIVGPITQTIDPISLSNNIINNLPEGQYLFTVIDSVGNECDTDISLTAPEPLTAAATKNDATCNCNGSIDLNIFGGVPPFKVKVTSSTYNLDWVDYAALQFNSLCGGNYTIMVRDKTNAIYTVNTILNSSPQLEIIGEINADVLMFAALGGTPPYVYDPQCTSGTCFENLPAGQTLTVTVTDSNNCTVSRTFTNG